MAVRQIRNGPRRLLSRSGGRLPALKQAVSKPDAEAEREPGFGSSQLANCQDLVAESTQNRSSDVGQLLRGNLSRNKLPLPAPPIAADLETIKARSCNRHGHIAFGPHSGRGKGMRQGPHKFDLHVIGHWLGRRTCAERDYRHKVTTPSQSRHDDNYGSALDHLWDNEALEVAQQDFTNFRIVHQCHTLLISNALAAMEGLA